MSNKDFEYYKERIITFKTKVNRGLEVVEMPAYLKEKFNKFFGRDIFKVRHHFPSGMINPRLSDAESLTELSTTQEFSRFLELTNEAQALIDEILISEKEIGAQKLRILNRSLRDYYMTPFDYAYYCLTAN